MVESFGPRTVPAIEGAFDQYLPGGGLAAVISDSLRSHGLQPTRLLCPWDSPGKNTGVGCHFLLQGSPQPTD